MVIGVLVLRLVNLDSERRLFGYGDSPLMSWELGSSDISSEYGPEHSPTLNLDNSGVCLLCMSV